MYQITQKPPQASTKERICMKEQKEKPTGSGQTYGSLSQTQQKDSSQ